MLKYIDIRDLKDNNRNSVDILGISIDIAKQKTGYGYKSFFICPSCGKRRERLFIEGSNFNCRSCINSNIYINRTNLFDEKGENLVRLKIIKILLELDLDIYQRYNLYSYNFSMMTYLYEAKKAKKPKYMRETKYSYLIKCLFFLDWMYWNCVSGLKNYTATDINQMLQKDNVEFVWDLFLFDLYHPGFSDEIKRLESKLGIKVYV